MESTVLRIEKFSAFFGENSVLKDINLSIEKQPTDNDPPATGKRV
jgi:ABC-type phosphate transport system ATPase subunit